MTCSNKGCKIKAKINPKTGLCQGCDEFFQGINRRVDHLDRRHQARDKSLDARRHLDSLQDSDELATSHPPGNNMVNFPSVTTASSIQSQLPNVDLNDIIKSCEAAKNGEQIDTGKVLGDMMGMMVHMFAKQSENDAIREQVNSNTDRIAHLEAKVGDASEVAYPRSLAIRKLPLPPHGVTELENVQHYLKEIKVEGFDVNRDVIKAIRKEASKHDPNIGPNLGTVLVELKCEEVRGKLMKTKKHLMNHPNIVMRSLIIKNAMSPSEMKAQNTHFGLLKMITGSNDFFIAGNGAIRKKDPNFNAQFPPSQPQLAPQFRQQVPQYQAQHQVSRYVPRPPPKPTHVKPPQPWSVPPPGPSQISRQEPPLLSQHVQYQAQPLQFQAFMAPTSLTMQNSTTEANLLGDFDFTSPQACAAPRTNSAPPQSQTVPSTSNTTPTQEIPQYQ